MTIGPSGDSGGGEVPPATAGERNKGWWMFAGLEVCL